MEKKTLSEILRSPIMTTAVIPAAILVSALAIRGPIRGALGCSGGNEGGIGCLSSQSEVRTHDYEEYFEELGMGSKEMKKISQKDWESALNQADTYYKVMKPYGDAANWVLDYVRKLPFMGDFTNVEIVEKVYGLGGYASRGIIAAAEVVGYGDEIGMLLGDEVLLTSILKHMRLENPATVRKAFTDEEINHARHIEEVSGVPAAWIIAIGMMETGNTTHVKSPADCVGTWQHQPETAVPVANEVCFFGKDEILSDTEIERDGVRVRVARHGDYQDVETGKYYMPEDQRRERLYHIAATAAIGWDKLRGFNAVSEDSNWMTATAKYNGAPGLRPGESLTEYILNAGNNKESRGYVVKAVFAFKGAIEALKEVREKPYKPDFTIVEVPADSPSLAELAKRGLGLAEIFNGYNEELMPRIPLSAFTQPLVIPPQKSGFGTKTLMRGYLKTEFKQHLANRSGIHKVGDNWVIEPSTFKAPSSDNDETSVHVTFATSKKMGTNTPTLSDIPVSMHDIVKANPQLMEELAVQEYMGTTYLRPGFDFKVSKGKAAQVCEALR